MFFSENGGTLQVAAPPLSHSLFRNLLQVICTHHIDHVIVVDRLDVDKLMNEKLLRISHNLEPDSIELEVKHQLLLSLLLFHLTLLLLISFHYKGYIIID